MKHISFLHAGLIAAALTTLPVIGLAASRPLNEADQARQLIADVRADAHTISASAGTLYYLANSPEYDWQVHAGELNAMKAAINRMGQNLVALEPMQKDLPATEQKGISQATELGCALAENTSKAIQYIREHPLLLWEAEYRGYADKISGEATQLSTLLDQYNKFARVHDKDLRLEQTLGAE